MPVHARINQANGHTVLIDIGEDHDFGVARELEALEHMDQQQANDSAEVHLLLQCDALVAEHQHMVLQMRAVDTGEVGGFEGLRQIQPQHLGTDSG
jgi:hypothetical protein